MGRKLLIPHDEIMSWLCLPSRRRKGYEMSIFSPQAVALRKAEAWIRSHGLSNFETAEDVQARHRRMVSSFYKYGLNKLADPFVTCKETCCNEKCTTDACHIHMRHRRLMAISTASPILSAMEGPKYFVTLIRPEWEVAKDQLYGLKPLIIRKRIQAMLRAAGAKVAVGSFEVSYNTQMDGSAHWAGGSLVCAGIE